MDRLTPQKRSENMRRIKSKDTSPELMVRRTVHALGFRFRLHAKHLPGAPDLAFVGRRKAIFVHGCFWHSHRGCVDGHIPRSRTEYWSEKLNRNKMRDRANLRSLAQQGWQILVIWECETKDVDSLSQKLRNFLGTE